VGLQHVAGEGNFVVEMFGAEGAHVTAPGRMRALVHVSRGFLAETVAAFFTDERLLSSMRAPVVF
jgi:hypothetical protein